ncbi:MAG: ATP-dependent Clp protease ATP-binding subunit [Phycisphaerales bacterium]|nr:ATP-dependent Clp protease ATP-binding subunit [Phycisphaerales bacterium]
MPHLNEDANAIKNLAQLVAGEQGLEYVGTEHLLIAIMRHGEGVGAEVLRAFGVDEHELTRKLETLVQHETEDTWVFGRLPGSPHYRNVIQHAIDEATQLESAEIGSEHLLLALLREDGSTAQRLLALYGVDLANARNKTLELM